MLKEDKLKILSGELKDLKTQIVNGVSPKDIKESATAIIESVAPKKGELGGPHEYLLRTAWKSARLIKGKRQVSSGWFFAAIRDQKENPPTKREDKAEFYITDEAAEALHDVFVELVTFVLEDGVVDDFPEILRTINKYFKKQGVLVESIPQSPHFKLKCEFYHSATEIVPDAYRENGRACGALVGNETELAFAITGKNDNRQLKAKAKSGSIFFRQLSDREFELFFRSFKDKNIAEEKLKSRPNSR